MGHPCVVVVVGVCPTFEFAEVEIMKLEANSNSVIAIPNDLPKFESEPICVRGGLETLCRIKKVLW